MSHPPKKADRVRIRSKLVEALDLLISVRTDPACPMVVRCAVDGAVICLSRHALTQKSIEP